MSDASPASPAPDRSARGTASRPGSGPIAARRPLSDAVARAVVANLRDRVSVLGAIRDDAGDVVDWRCHDIDPRVAEWLGLTPEAIATKTMRELLPERLAEVHELWKQVLASGEPRDYERSYDGRDHLVRAFRIDDETIGTAAIDVSERNQALDALRMAETRLRALVEKSLDITALVDGEGRITYWSPGATSSLGWDEAELIGRPFVELVHPDDLADARDVFAEIVAAHGEPVHQVARVRHRDGTWHRVEGVSRNLLADPDLRAVVVNARDTTRQQQLEDQFRQAQKLESVGRLAGGVAHDFNNLLTVILNCASFLEQERREGRLATPEYVEHILAAGERAADLTRQLLAFARKQVADPVVLDPNAVVRGSEKLLRRVLGEDVELVVRTQPVLGPVLCDRGQLEQVLMNLAVNARDAMPDGGRLEIATRSESIPEGEGGRDPHRRPGEWVVLAVRDEGAGMSAETLSHLFEPFFTTKPVGKGTGLGLATVHGIVTQNGGFVRVSSALGVGTTFEVVLPRTTQAPRTVAGGASAPTARGRETVLLIEDDALVRGVIGSILRSGGYVVVEARHGEEALAAPRETGLAPELVVSDVVMPGMSGPETVRRLREERPGLPAVFLSGYRERPGASEPDAADEGGVLLKPFTSATLLAKVRSVLDREGSAGA